MMEELTELLNTTLFQYQKLHLTVGSIVNLAIILVVLKILLRLFRAILKRAMRGSDKAQEHTIFQVFKYFAYTIAIVLSIEALGFDVTIILGASAALLVGVGLGLQEVFRDVFSGIVLLFEGTFKVGDVIEIDGMVCQVRRIDLRTSQVETRDGVMVIVPNSRLVQENMVNWSLNKRDTRFQVTVGVAYGSDTQLVRKLLEETAKNHPSVTLKDQVFVKFHDFGDSALIFQLFFWTDKQWIIESIKSELRFRIDQTFRDHGVKIPFPQRDLHVVSDFRESPGNEQAEEQRL